MDNLYIEILNYFDDEDGAEILISVERGKFIIGVQQLNHSNFVSEQLVETTPHETVENGLKDVLIFLKDNFSKHNRG